MPFDLSGNFTRYYGRDSWTADLSAGTKIVATRHDHNDDDIADGLSQCITKNGKTQITADIPFNGKKITGLGAPVNATDAATKQYADTIKNFTTGIDIQGAAANGKVTFSAATGENGLSWTDP